MFENHRRLKLARHLASEIVFAAAALLMLSAAQMGSKEVADQENNRFTGRWVLDSVEYGGETTDSFEQTDTWHFARRRLKRDIGSRKVDEARFEIFPNKNPKEIDFVPIESRQQREGVIFKTRTKALYSFENGRLKIALTFRFAPGTPEAEKERAIEYARIRPKSFNTKGGDVVVLTLRREKDSEVE